MKVRITYPAYQVTTTMPARDVEFEFPDCPEVVPPVVVVPPPPVVVVPPPPVVVVPPPPVTVKYTGDAAKIGVCTFPWVPLEKLQMFSFVRAYIASGWVWRPAGAWFQPMFQAAKPNIGISGLDDYFSKAKALGIEVLPCINQTPDWYAGGGDGSGSNNWPPIKPGLNREDPASWADWAEFWFQFAARYGRFKHPDNVLHIDEHAPRWTGDEQPVKKSGLGLIQMVEIGNEWDRWWNTEQALSPKAHAAMLSACYDAVNRADHSMAVVMGGLTGLDAGYLQEMEAWFFRNRADKNFAADVLNVHHYSNLGNSPDKWPPQWAQDGGCMPELDKALEPGLAHLRIITAITKRPCWITEFGPDTIGPAQNHIKGIGMSDDEAQGEAIIRSMLAHLAGGMGRTCAFTAINEPGAANGSGGDFNSCGLFTGENANPPFAPKPSALKVAWLIGELDGYFFSKNESTATAKVFVFSKLGGKDKALCWAIDADAPITLFGSPALATNRVNSFVKQ